MDCTAIQTLYRHTVWANNRIIDTARQLSITEFLAPTTHCYGSVRNTLVHILEAELMWRTICQFQHMAAFLEPAAFPTLDAITQVWLEEQQAMHTYLASLTHEQLNLSIHFETENGLSSRVVWYGLFDMMNHGTQHRSEVAHMLTMCGYSPGDLDFCSF